MRVFYALPLWDTLDTRAMQKEIGAEGLRWIPSHQLHLTLCFKGEIADDQIPSAIAELEHAARLFPPFSLHWERTGVFPQWRRPRVLWLGIGDPEAGGIRKLGLALGNNALTPHVTVARVKRPVENEILERWKRFSPPDKPVFVDRISLIQSILHSTGPEYRILSEAELQGAMSNE